MEFITIISFTVAIRLDLCLLYVALSLTHKIRHFNRKVQPYGPDKNKQRL